MRILDVGCGINKYPGAIGIDRLANTRADIVADLDQFPFPVRDSAFDEVRAIHVIEHVGDVIRTMEEFHRLLRHGGRVVIETPHYTDFSSFCDPTHRWHLNSFSLRYFGDDCAPCGNCDICLDPPEIFDGSVSAQKLLSCIYRTGERFGQAHVISVLLGESDERIERLGHDTLSTFGIGREHDRNAWRSIVRQLVAHRLINVDVSGHGGLSISAEGRLFLRQKPALSLRAAKKAKPERKAARRDAREAIPPDGRALFEALRARRLELAKAANVPPYVIFHDKTLVDMASRRPQSLAGMAAIPGVGEAKLARYGDAFLEVIQGHAL